MFSTQLDSVAHLREDVKKQFDRYKSFWYIIGRPTQELNVLDVDQLYIVSFFFLFNNECLQLDLLQLI